MPFVVVYDACVLYPAPLRVFLLRLARTGIVQAKWSDKILDTYPLTALIDFWSS